MFNILHFLDLFHLLISTVYVSALVKSTSFKMSTGEIIKSQSQTKQSGSLRKNQAILVFFFHLWKGYSQEANLQPTFMRLFGLSFTNKHISIPYFSISTACLSRQRAKTASLPHTPIYRNSNTLQRWQRSLVKSNNPVLYFTKQMNYVLNAYK